MLTIFNERGEGARMRRCLWGIAMHCLAAAKGDAGVVSDGSGDDFAAHVYEAHSYLGSILALACEGLGDYAALDEYNEAVEKRLSGEVE